MVLNEDHIIPETARRFLKNPGISSAGEKTSVERYPSLLGRQNLNAIAARKNGAAQNNVCFIIFFNASFSRNDLNASDRAKITYPPE